MEDYVSKYTGPEIDDALSRAMAASNQNLLDNSVFLPGCLVDQRGGYVVPPNTPYVVQATGDSGTTGDEYVKVDYIAADGVPHFTHNSVECYCSINSVVRGYTGAGYGIDRWFINEHGTLLINDDCISIEGMHRQFIENGVEKFCGKLCCFSVLTKDGELFSGHGIVPTNGTNNFYRENDVLLYSYSGGNTLSVLMKTYNGKFIQPIAAKLELGDHQTLAHQDANGNWVLNELPNYAEQLARCQRYFVNLSLDASLCCIANGINNGNFQIAIFEIPTPVTMAKTPVITDVKKKGRIIFPSGEAVKGINVFVDTVHAASVRVYFTNTGNSSYVPVALEDYGFSFSADL